MTESFIAKPLHGALVSVYQENCQRTALILSTVNECALKSKQRWPRNTCAYIPVIVEWFLQYLDDFLISCHSCVCQNILSHFLCLSLSSWTVSQLPFLMTRWSVAAGSDWPSLWRKKASTVPATALPQASWKWTSLSYSETVNTRQGKLVSIQMCYIISEMHVILHTA